MQGRAEQLYPIWKYYPSFLTKTFDVSNKKIHSIVRKKIQKRKEMNLGDDSKKCLLDILLDAQPVHKMTDKEIEDEMITWVMGGHETTASLISWTFYLLGKYPECLKKVVEEVKEVVKEKSGNGVVVPSYEELQKMEYLNCVLKETLR
jgi:cytochrome P450